MEDLLQVGIITSTHGVRGEVKVYPTTDDPRRFRRLKEVVLDTGREKLNLEIEGVKFFKQFVILKFKGLDNINDIEKYRQKSLYVTRKNAVRLQRDEYFIADLIGLKVQDEDGTELGTVKDVIETGANDVYEVEMADGRSLLLPAIKQCILNVDVENGMMQVHILTLFPEMVQQGLATSILGRAAEKNLISINAVNIRDYTQDKHGKVDDYTYGGGAGMLMQAQPVYDAYRSVAGEKKIRCVYLTPQGEPFTQKKAKELSGEEELVLLCGHYEGIDERVLEEIVTDYVSIGDYVLTGGELPAMVMVDAISRMVPGVLTNDESGSTESFEGNLLEYPQYSRPEEWMGKKVPSILLSGDHKKVDEWRREQAILRTIERRPDLLKKAELTKKEQIRYQEYLL